MNPIPALVYLAEPIDNTSSPLQVASQIVSNLTTWGWTVYRPYSAWRVVGALDPRIDQANRSTLRHADVIVAVLDPTVSSIGVPTEIEYATGLGIPAVVCYSGKSQVLAANPLVTVVDNPSAVVQAVETALKAHPPSLEADPNRKYLRLVIRDGHDAPVRVYPDDAGLDLTTVKEYVIHPGEFVDIHTQVDYVQLPEGYWGMITGRSSTLRRHKLHVPLAVIDPGWRGPLFIGVWNLGPEPIKVQPGDRLGQLILLPNNPALTMLVHAVADSPRGTQGFGSSG